MPRAAPVTSAAPRVRGASSSRSRVRLSVLVLMLVLDLHLELVVVLDLPGPRAVVLVEPLEQRLLASQQVLVELPRAPRVQHQHERGIRVAPEEVGVTAPAGVRVGVRAEQVVHLLHQPQRVLAVLRLQVPRLDDRHRHPPSASFRWSKYSLRSETPSSTNRWQTSMWLSTFACCASRSRAQAARTCAGRRSSRSLT